MESLPSLLERTVDSALLLLSSPPSSLSPPTESKFSIDSEESSCMALSNSKSCSSSVTNEDGSPAETRAHPLRMIAVVALCHEMKLKVVRNSRSKKFWRSDTRKPIYSGKPTEVSSERASETTLSCESCSSGAVSSTRSRGGGGGWKEEEEASLARNSKQKLPGVAKSALMRRGAEAISITWLFFSDCTPTSEVRIRRLLGDSPDTCKALWMFLKWEEVKRSSADGRGDSYLYTMRNRLGIDTLDIGYIRDLFPERNFNYQPDPALDIKIKKLMPMDAQLQRLIDWIEKVSFSYSNSDSHEVSMTINRTRNKKYGGTLKFNSMTEIAPTLNPLMRTLGRMLEQLLKKNKDPTEDERQVGSVKDWISCYHLDNFHAGVLSISPYIFVVIVAYLFDLFSFRGCGAPSLRPYLRIDEASATVSPDWLVLVSKHRDYEEFEFFYPRTGLSSKKPFTYYTRAVIRASSIEGWLLLTRDGQIDGEPGRVDYYNINTDEFIPLPPIDVRDRPYGLFNNPRSLTMFAQLLDDGTLTAYKHNFGDDGWIEVNKATVTQEDSNIVGGLALWNNSVLWFDTFREIHHYSVEEDTYLHAPFIDDLDGMIMHVIIPEGGIVFDNEAAYLFIIGLEELKIYTLRVEDTILTQRMASLGARCFYPVGSAFGYSLRAEGGWEEGKILMTPNNTRFGGHFDLYDTLGEHPHVPSDHRECPDDGDLLCKCNSAWVRLAT